MSFNEFLLQRFEGHEGTEELRDIVKHGMSGGVSGFIYYHELYTLFLDFDDEILNHLGAEYGESFSNLARDCEGLNDLAQKAVWMYVESWAFAELQRREKEIEDLMNIKEYSVA